MKNSKKNFPHVNNTVFIDYKSEELCVKTQWLVVYYAKNSVTHQMERFRIHVSALKSKTERKLHEKRIVNGINEKLNSVTSPDCEE